MDRRERIEDPIEAQRAAQDGRQAELWTALPGIVQSFDPVAHTVTVQLCIKGSITGPDGKTTQVNLPVLPDVPVVFPHGGGFSLTYPLKNGDEVLVVFGARCIDAWWQSGGVQAEAELRMHDLSDGLAIPGPWSQARKLDPPMHTEHVQLRTDDGKAYVAIRPDQTIEAVNEKASVTLTPDGSVQSVGAKSVTADAPDIVLTGGQSITLNAPQIVIAGNLTWTGHGGGAGAYAITGQLNLKGSMDVTQTVTSGGDQVAGGISQINHTHTGVMPGGGNTGQPQ